MNLKEAEEILTKYSNDGDDPLVNRAKGFHDCHEKMKPIVEALELLMENWPPHRDGMDYETLPIGVKGGRFALETYKKDVLGEE